MFRIISDSYLGFCCWDGLDQVWVLGEGHMQLWKQKKKVIIWWKTPRTFWCKVQLLQLWTGASVCLYWHNVYWFLTLFQCIGSFIEVFLEVMMILTLSHFENQLHPSRHTNASSHAVDPFFCSVRGSFGKKMKKHNINVKVLSVWIDGWLELSDLAIKHWFMIPHYFTAMCSHSLI